MGGRADTEAIMNRRMLTASVASVIASVGLASGQTASPAAATEGAPTGSSGIVTLRTAGQPDRRLQVLKCERLPDGKILTEVKDLTTGQTFTITDTKPFAGIEPAGAKPSAAQPQAVGTFPGTVVPATTLPSARSRTQDPLLAGTTVPAAVTNTVPNAHVSTAPRRPATIYETPATTRNEYPTLIGKLRGSDSMSTTTSAPAITNTAPSRQSGLSAALFGTNGSEPTTTMGGVSNNPPRTQTVSPVTAMPNTAMTTIPTSERGGLRNAFFGGSDSPTPVSTMPTANASNPTLMGRLFGDKPAPMTVAQTPSRANMTASAGVIRPSSLPASNARVMATPPNVPAYEARVTQVSPVSPVSALPAPSIPTSVATVATPAASPLQPASYAPTSGDAKDPNFHVVAAQPMTMKQIEDQVKELRMNQRPSKRMEAATALAHGPMANMVEVRQVLAEATYRDPVGVVRAHCIDLLAKMKYDEYNYKQYVETLVNDEEPAVQRSARAAVK
jgi:hypothetical protein